MQRGHPRSRYEIHLLLCALAEFIVKLGSIQTPQLLELSGIGNHSILRPLGIETIIDLPGVGEHLRMHYT